MKRGFTIVELLVVIVVIGVLASVVLIAYNGISGRAVAASLQSDLAGAKKQLENFKTLNSTSTYPTANNCTNTTATEICLKPSGGNTLTYTPGNTTNPTTYSLVATNGGTSLQSSSTTPGSGDIAPNQVTSGLILSLDAGNPASYPGTGTTWTDLSGNGNNFTLYNSPTYSSAYGGSIGFNGSTSWAKMNNNTTADNLSAMTVSIWVNHNSTGVWTPFVAKTDNYGSGSGWELGRYPYLGGTGNILGGYFQTQNAGGTIWRGQYTPPVLTTNTWFNFVGTYSTGFGDDIKLYINGSQVAQTNFSTGGTLPSISTTSAVSLAKRDGTGPQYTNCNIATVSIYNRALSASEISQNFNATRARFGM